MHTTRRAPTLLLMALSLLALPACRIGGERSVSEENDRLRKLVHTQEADIKSLQGERDELKAKLAESAKAASTSPDILDAIPRVTSLELSSLSGFDPADPSKPATKVVFYLHPLDGRGRFTQAVGTLTAEALLLPTQVGESSPPQRLGTVTLTPTQLRDAYRSNFTGTHYTIELPLQTPVTRTPAPPSLLLRIQLVDALTGQTHTAEKVISPYQASTAK